MGYEKFKRQIAARGGIAVAGSSSIAAGSTVTDNGTHAGTPQFSGTPAVTGRLDASAGQFRAPVGTAANGTATLPVAAGGFMRLHGAAGTYSIGFVINGTAFSLRGTPNGPVTIVEHS